MRLAVLALLLISLAGATSAQPEASEPARVPTTSDRLILVGSAFAGGVVASPGGPFLILGAGVGTYAASRALSLDPTLGGVLLDTAVGAGVGWAVGGAAFLVLSEVAGNADLSASLGSVFVGLAVASAATGVSHGVRLAWLRSDRVEAAPGVLTTPEGETVPALALRIGL